MPGARVEQALRCTGQRPCSRLTASLSSQERRDVGSRALEPTALESTPPRPMEPGPCGCPSAARPSLCPWRTPTRETSRGPGPSWWGSRTPSPERPESTWREHGVQGALHTCQGAPSPDAARVSCVCGAAVDTHVRSSSPTAGAAPRRVSPLGFQTSGLPERRQAC